MAAAAMMRMSDVEHKTLSLRQMSRELSELERNGLFELGGDRLHVPLPPLPAWMLDTPMYSKLPMVPAPKGKIVLYTTMLCKKLHQTPDDLDFDPVAAGLCCEYQSLHDPHLKSHYTRPVTYDRLVKSGHITPDGMVKCTLKEFNDYHQYLKAVCVEKLTQERKRQLAFERESTSRARKQSIRKEVSERDKLIKDSLVKQKKVLDRARAKLARKLQTDCRKTMIRLMEQRRLKTALQQTRREANEEKHRAIRMNLDIEHKLKRAMIMAKRSDEELRSKDQLSERRKQEKAERERKLEDQWNRRERMRAQRMLREARKLSVKQEEMMRKVVERDESVAEHREQQDQMLVQICEDRQKRALQKEVRIAERLEEKLESVCRKYTTGRKRGRRRFPPINPKLTTNMTTWNVQERQHPLHRPEGEGEDTDKLPPIVSSGESTPERKRSGPPSLAIYESSLPTVHSSVYSKDALTTVSEGESDEEAHATGDAPVSVPEAIDSFTLVARQLVTDVFDELKADPEFADVEWEEEEEEEEAGGSTEEQKPAVAGDSSSSQGSYIDASDVSRNASLMVARALESAVTLLMSPDQQMTADRSPETQESFLVARASYIVSGIMEDALARLKLDSEPGLEVTKRKQEPTVEERAESIVSGVIAGSLSRLSTGSPPDGTASDSRPEPSSEADRQDRASDRPDTPAASESGVTRGSVLLSSIIDVFTDPPDSIPSITHTAESSESEDELDDDRVIGIVAHPGLLDDDQEGGGGDLDIDEGLVAVVHEHDGVMCVEGAVLTTHSAHSGGLLAEHSVTERVLSNIDLERASGSLADTESVPKVALLQEDSSSNDDDADDEEDEEEEEEIPAATSSIIPVYQKHTLDIGSGLIEHNLSAVSQKPGEGGLLPGGAGKCGARNSFRNIFRPDMTYCQGSARALRDSLVKEITASRVTASVPTTMEMVCEVLEKEEHDIMEKHSDEALVTVEETEGLCYLPTRRQVGKATAVATPPPATHDAAAPAHDASQTTSADAPPPKTSPDVPPDSETADPNKPAVLEAAPSVGGDDAVAAVAIATEDRGRAPDGKQISETSVSRKTDAAIPASRSAVEAREGVASAAGKLMSSRHEVSVQSVDASSNLAIERGEEGSEQSPKRSGHQAKKVTRSSSLISGVISRLSHVFSSTHRRQSDVSCRSNSHESASEPASRRISKRSVDDEAAAPKMATARPEGEDAADQPQHDQEGGEGGADAPHHLHHGASVHFAVVSVEPPAKKESIYASHRPQTPVPKLGRQFDEEEDEDEEDVVDVIDADDVEEEEAEPTSKPSPAAPDDVEEVQGDEAGKVAAETDDTNPNEEMEPSAANPSAEAEADVSPVNDEAEIGNQPDNPKPAVDNQDEETNPGANPESSPEAQVQVENDSNNANTDGSNDAAGSKSPSGLPSIRSAQLPEPNPVPSGNRSSNSGQVPDAGVASRTSTRGGGYNNPQPPPGGRSRDGSRTSGHSGGWDPNPPAASRSSNRSATGAQSMTITGRALAPIGSKGAKSATSAAAAASGKEGGSAKSLRTQSGRRGGPRSSSRHKRTDSGRMRGSVVSQSASKVMSAYGSSGALPGSLSVTGSQILPGNQPSSSRMHPGNRRSSRTQATPISATNLTTTASSSSRGSQGRARAGGRGVVSPRPPLGARPSASGSKSGHRAVRQPVGAQAFSNPTLASAKGSSSVMVNHREPSSEKLLPRRPSLEKGNMMERLSTESVSSRRSSQERVGKKKSDSSQPPQDEPAAEQNSPASSMPPIKESITPRPPSRPHTSRKSSGISGKTPAATERGSAASGQGLQGEEQVARED